MAVRLSASDCTNIQDFCKKLAKADLADFEVPIYLFSRSFHTVDVTDRALDLIITLESLLSQSSESIAYKIAFRASCLTAANEEERWEMFRFAKKVYEYKSSLVHGNKKELARARSELRQHIERIGNLARKCLLLACLLQADRHKLPSGKSANMRSEDSIDEYILTYCVIGKGTTPLDSLPAIGALWQSTRVL